MDLSYVISAVIAGVTTLYIAVRFIRELSTVIKAIYQAFQYIRKYFSNRGSTIHIVVDNSNVFIGAQNNNAAVRVNIKKLVAVIEKHKSSNDIKTRIVGGSTPPKGARVWTEWEACGYKCFLGERSACNKEVFLDDMLHSQMFRLFLNQESNQYQRQVLVLISGDGNANEGRTSFPEVVRNALKRQWKVEVWSWGSCLSNKFREIQREYPNNMEIYYLDEHKHKITFIEKNNQIH